MKCFFVLKLELNERSKGLFLISNSCQFVLGTIPGNSRLLQCNASLHFISWTSFTQLAEAFIVSIVVEGLFVQVLVSFFSLLV